MTLRKRSLRVSAPDLARGGNADASEARARVSVSRAPPVDREGPVHRAILQLLRVRLPPASRATIMHAANEMGVHGASKRHREIAGAKAKALGVRSGWPDLQWIGPGGVLMAFEVKPPRPHGRVSDAQSECGAAIAAAGGRWAVVRAVDEADALLREWGCA